MAIYPNLAPFVELLNNDPTDWGAVGVLADFLDDRDDVPPNWKVLAPGFRALSHHHRAPWWYRSSCCWSWLHPYSRYRRDLSGAMMPSVLPNRWHGAIEANRHVRNSGSDRYTECGKPKNHNGVLILKAAARAFAKLPDDYRHRVMSAEPGNLEGL